MNIKQFTIILLIAGVFSSIATAAPQNQEAPEIQAAIDYIFQQPSQAPPRARPGDVVTPVPNFTPTVIPQTLVSDGVQCTCVPYHQCDPKTNTTFSSGGPTNTQDQQDGFGLIDIRFNPDDCQDVLDVCCKDLNRQEQSITLPPEKKPMKASGCGIRNVGGIDFQITGAFVSMNICVIVC